jgi:hypothetical protein
MPKDAETGRSRLHALRDRLGELLPLVDELLRTEARAPQVRETAGAYRGGAPPGEPAETAGNRYRVGKYGNTRHYALYEGDQLLAVTVYRRGAETIRERLESLEEEIARLTPGVSGRGSAVARLRAERERGRGW